MEDREPENIVPSSKETPLGAVFSSRRKVLLGMAAVVIVLSAVFGVVVNKIIENSKAERLTAPIVATFPGRGYSSGFGSTTDIAFDYSIRTNSEYKGNLFDRATYFNEVEYAVVIFDTDFRVLKIDKGRWNTVYLSDTMNVSVEGKQDIRICKLVISYASTNDGEWGQRNASDEYIMELEKGLDHCNID